MLDDARVEPLQLEPNGAPSTSCASSVDRAVPLDRDEHALEREAALVVGLQLLARLDDRAG